jgi:hypothetical protein
MFESVQVFFEGLVVFRNRHMLTSQVRVTRSSQAFIDASVIKTRSGGILTPRSIPETGYFGPPYGPVAHRARKARCIKLAVREVPTLQSLCSFSKHNHLRVRRRILRFQNAVMTRSEYFNELLTTMLRRGQFTDYNCTERTASALANALTREFYGVA